jgi:hypothetical protein
MHFNTRLGLHPFKEIKSLLRVFSRNDSSATKHKYDDLELQDRAIWLAIASVSA